MRKILVILLILWPLLQGFSQQKEGKSRIGSKIVDDSTKNIYGPKTTRWISEKDIFYNKSYYQPLDTTIANYHRWTYAEQFRNFYQDLGYVGTALHSIFPLLPTAIGVSPGYTAYEPYYNSEEVKYFDTKSPYARMYVVWGGNGRAATRIEFSRNINPRWNFGFNYRPLLVDKQIQRKGKGDRQTISHYIDTYMTFRTKDEKYSFLFNYRRIRHKVNENGAVNVTKPPDSTYASLFQKTVRPKLSTATSIEQRNNFHYFQQYKIGKALQIYQKGDWGKQYNLYHEDLTTPTTYYDHYEKNIKDSVKVKDSVKFSYLQNEFGVKGNVKNLFYDFYYKIRSYQFSYKYLNSDSLKLNPKSREHYAGARVLYSFDSLNSLGGWAEYLLDGNYRIEGELKTKWIDAFVQRMQSKPGFVQNAYRGRFDYWNYNFNNLQSDHANAFLKANLGPLFISPGFTYTAYQNYIYYLERTLLPLNEQRVLPVQSAGKQILISPELRMDFRFFKYYHIRPQMVYSKFIRNDENALRVPELFVNTQLAFENMLFHKNIQVQIGTDIHWHSAYTALGYDPAIQQFYVQDKVISPAFPLVDIFLNGRIKTGKFFVKYHNIVQLFTKTGYMPTPGYPNQRNILDFGFELLLFD